jgi:hypothetical protein
MQAGSTRRAPPVKEGVRSALSLIARTRPACIHEAPGRHEELCATIPTRATLQLQTTCVHTWRRSLTFIVDHLVRL